MSSLNGIHSILRKKKMSMPHYLKFLSQLKDYLNKSVYEKNFNLVINKEWINYFQKITYAQLESVRKYTDNRNDNKKYERINETGETSRGKGVRQSVATALAEIDKREEFPDSERRADIPEIEEDKKQSGKEIAGSYSLPNVFNGFMPKLSQKLDDNSSVVVPKWKNNVDNVTKNSIASRTRHVLTSIAVAESNASRWRRVEDLLAHIDQYPDARHYAIKEGAIRILLGIRQTCKDDQTKGSMIYQPLKNDFSINYSF